MLRQRGDMPKAASWEVVGLARGPWQASPTNCAPPATLDCPEPTGSHDLTDPAEENCCVPAASL